MTSASDNPRVHHGAYGTCRDPTNRLLLVHLASGLDKGLWALPGESHAPSRPSSQTFVIGHSHTLLGACWNKYLYSL
ncbi:MAG: hypothetical protein OSB73_02700 [Candidatus Latescibacteria bacterium]|nr:hypothetical protein [Candidatus Latescibacterota bacterium]